MRKFHFTGFYKNLLLVAIILMGDLAMSIAQTTVQIGTGTDVPASTLYSPVYRASATSSVTSSRSNVLYLQSELAAAGIPVGATITKVEFNKRNANNFVTPATHAMYMANTMNTSLSTSSTWASVQATHTQVFTSNSFNMPAAAGWVAWDISPFVYTGGALEIAHETSMTGNGGATGSFQWEYTAGVSAETIVGVIVSNNGTPGAVLNGISTSVKYRPNIKITFTPPPACTMPPVPGTATATPAGMLCNGAPLTLNLTGYVLAANQKYRWEISSDPLTGFSQLSDELVYPVFTTTTMVGTRYYRCAVTCGTSTEYSTVVSVTGPAPLAGAYTIKPGTTAGNNFASFSDAAAALNCRGVSGAVTFDVDPASGPYTEQVIINKINGSSVANTVTFNGNGRELSFASSNANEQAVFRLNGASHVIIDSLIITATGTTSSQYGYGIYLTNNADSNTIKRCVINVTTASSSANYLGVAVTTESDNNLFEKNTITGGYYGISCQGTTVNNSPVAVGRNQFINNIVKDFYVSGILCDRTSSTLIRGNDFSRPARTVNAATIYGIYFTGLNTRALADGNRVHALFGGNVASTNAATPIYFDNADALAGLENKVINNAIYDIRSNGIIYAIYNNGSDNVQFYHNTISLDDLASTGTGATCAFLQNSQAAGIEFKNNLVTLRRGGTGSVYGLYFLTAASSITSNNNNIFIPAGVNKYFGNNGTNRVTLADWQAASSQDANSSTYSPSYANLATGDLKPNAPLMNDRGVPLNITTDIIGAARNGSTPDIGAWEYTPTACIAPPEPGISTASVGVICAGLPVSLGVQDNSLGIGQTYQWQASTTAGGPWNNISSDTLKDPTFTIYPTETLYYRCKLTCSGMEVYAAPVQVVVTPLLAAGTYIIDATGNGNFTSFNAAYAAMNCGIAGPVVFEVKPGSGPYTEQLIMGPVRGASVANTITWNGRGETITFKSTNTSERAVIKLNDADHFIFDSLVVAAQGRGSGEYGFGFHLTNNADSNRISNCVINLDPGSFSANHAGIVSTGGTTAFATGANGSDYNEFDNNTINGGYYGLSVYNVATNKITNNTIRDFYRYGIYLSGNAGTLVEGNDIARPSRTDMFDYNGVYVTGQSQSLLVSKNRFHNPFGGNLSSTDDFIGIYFSNVTPPAGAENTVSNNVVYNINGAGEQYGLGNVSSGNTRYYYNTVNLDNAVSSSAVAYGFFQFGNASGIDLKNNLFSISKAGSANKFGLYFGTTTTTYASDNNGFFTSGTNTYIGYNGSNQSTLANWQSASSQDANSVFGNPYYTDPGTGNLKPRSLALDNKGAAIDIITTDIENNMRSAGTPDVGAWEFSVPACTTPPTAGDATAVPNTGICLGTPIKLDLVNNSIGAGQTYQWQFATSANGTYTNLGSPLLFSDTTIAANGTLWYRCMVTCNGQSAYSAPVQVNMNPPFPAGTYTINNTLPTTWPTAGAASNFNSFVEAVDVMNCGIGGPVTFNVAAGTYDEQVRMRPVAGASASNRITFQSATGNPSSVTLTNTTGASNYVLQLDSAGYITYKNMTITAASAAKGRAIHFAGTASNDSILNCVVNVPASTGTTEDIVGIYGSGMSGNDVVIKGNTITGGMAGIHFSGFSDLFPARRVTIDSNTVNAAYYYNIYTANMQFTKVINNTVTLTMPANTTAVGIYLTNNDSAYQVNANKINISGKTGTADVTIGIYLDGCDAVANTGSVSGNKVVATMGNAGPLTGIYLKDSKGSYTVNNAINLSTTAETAYGLYSTGVDGVKYYNNTVVNASPAAATTNFAASFDQRSSRIGAGDIRNNIFSHTGGGYALIFANTGHMYSDFNMLYSASDKLVRQGTTDYATLQAWRNVLLWDNNSIVYQPAFVAGTTEPDPANAGSWAMQGRGVQIADNASDINGNARPTTLVSGVPDLGAYEFMPTVAPPVLTATPAAPAPGTTQVFTLGTDTVQKITWNAGSTVPANVEIRRYSGVIPPGLATGQPSMYFYTDADYTGPAPTSFNLQQFYIDPWMRNIPAEPTVKMGRTVADGTWFVSSNSTVGYPDVITEQNLAFLDKFTGMTDGMMPPDRDIVSLDSSNSGRRFRVGYGHHAYFYENSQDMVLYLSAEQPANVTVKINGTDWRRDYSIPANTVRVSDFIPKAGLIDARLKDEGLSDRTISIESDVPIVAYAHIYALASSGASMLLPAGTYGYEYTILNTGQRNRSEGSGIHSWFYVIADKDSTLVEITPSQTTVGGRPAGVPFRVYLKKGQVYNVMGMYNAADANGVFVGVDMSGSTVKSIPNESGKCFPVAVFSGSSNTALCDNGLAFGADNIIQQAFPNQAWGTKYLTFATAQSYNNPTTYHPNKWRILVKDPATVVKRNGTVIPQSSLVTPGNYYEFGINEGDGPSTASYIEADQPVMVAQYMLTQYGGGCGLSAPSGSSDPEMIYISPLEQGIKKAVFYNTQKNLINQNYINVVISKAGLNSLKIDGDDINTFTDVFDHPYLAGYSCVRHNLPAAAGQHIIQSDSAFNAITYGMGLQESYGYNAGTLVKNLNAVPSFNNVFSASGSNTYTCKGTPFRMRIQTSVKPTQLVWKISEVPNITPNTDVTQTNPVPTDSVTINGKKQYIYTLAQQYMFTQTGDYTIPIQIFHPDIEGCNGFIEILLPVTVTAAPVADFTVTGSGCVSDVFTFNGTTTGGLPATQWMWNFGDATTGVGQAPTHTYSTAGTYNVSLRGIASDGCVADTTKQVLVNARPVVDITQDTLYVCNNTAATFTVRNPVAGVTYNWYSVATGGTPIGTGTSFVLPNVTGFTKVYLEGVQAGCASVARDSATAGALPLITAPVVAVDSVGSSVLVFRWNAVTGATGYEVSINGGATWMVPSSGSQGLVHRITGLALGASVTLQVRAVGSCQPAESQAITGQTITDQVYIPNAFTPNNDGLNDVFRVYSNSIRSMRFAIFNQLGEKIFESTSQLTGWDGTHKGKKQPSGVYMYVCEIILTSGEKVQRKGAINLVR